ncbi:MAG TPA: hypothetical protein VGE98_00735, partial [Thermoanaerobaculia bacterium]
HAEKKQLQLLDLALRRGAELPAAAESWLVRSDPKSCYRELVARSAQVHEERLRTVLRATAGGGDDPADDDIVLRVLRDNSPRALGRVGREAIAYDALGGGLDRLRELFDSYSLSFRRIHEAANPEARRLSWRDELAVMTMPSFSDVGAQIRALAEARELARHALRLRRRARGQDCAAALAGAGRPPSWMTIETLPDGACRLTTADRAEYMKLFAPKHPPPLEWRVPPDAGPRG